MDAGIQVINIDREFSTPSAFHTWIGGDNYGIGVQAGNFFADQLKCKGNVVEIQGLAGISVTEQRSKGFSDQLNKRCQGGIKIVASQPADFVPDKGLSVMENILQSQKQIDAVYTHDDDMGEGVAAAIENANRQDEMWMTGAGGSKKVMEKIKEGGLWKATFLYNPSMSADAVYLASLLGPGEGPPGLRRSGHSLPHPTRRDHGDAGERRSVHGASASETAPTHQARRSVSPFRRARVARADRLEPQRHVDLQDAGRVAPR